MFELVIGLFQFPSSDQAFLACCIKIKKSIEFYLFKLEKPQKKNKSLVFSGFECLRAFVLMSIQNYVRSRNVRSNNVR